MTALADRFRRLIAATGPIPVARYMAEANAHYYATRDPLGAAGDFTTAPEISQMFGELVGLWAADLWHRAGRPHIALVELGPGRGTLMADALRAAGKAGLTPPVHFVETSPTLRAAQADRVPHATWHDDLSTLPDDRSLIVLANEFFDALPIRQLVRTTDGWHERMIALDDEALVFAAGPPAPDPGLAADIGAIAEASPACLAIATDLAQRIAVQGGAALLIDYGYEGPAIGDTLQALRNHRFAEPLAEPGDADLTAHVDFTPLAETARGAGLGISGPIGQGLWLEALGIGQRAATLSRLHPAREQEIAGQRTRLTNTQAMGELFRVMAIHAPAWPQPEGFTL